MPQETLDNLEFRSPVVQVTKEELKRALGGEEVGFLFSSVWQRRLKSLWTYVTQWRTGIARDIFSIEDYGPTGDGIADDTVPMQTALAEIAAAGVVAATLHVPRVYKITSALTIPDNVKLLGDGSDRSKIIKAFNGDLMTLGNASSLEWLWIDGGYSSGYTGRGVLIPGGFRQRIRDCRVDNCDGYAIEYTAALAGTFSSISGCMLGDRNPPYVAIGFPDDGPGLGNAAARTIHDCRTGGAILANMGGAAVTFITDTYCNGINFTSDTNTALITNCRIATVGAPWVVDGTHVIIANCAIAGDVTFAAGSLRCQFGPTNLISPTVGVTDLGTDNEIYDDPRAYTPVWTSPGVAPVLNDGTIEGVYSRQGYMMTVNIRLIMGAATTYGNAADGWTFSLPSNQPAIGSLMTVSYGQALIRDDSVPTYLPFVPVQAAAGNAILNPFDGTTGLMRLNNPIVWATGDEVNIQVTYSLKD